MDERIIKIQGTHRQGIIETNYHKLSTTFEDDGFELANLFVDKKSKAEWLVEGEVDGEKVIATIYDWKEDKGVHYNTKWHIGGHDKKALELVKQLFPKCNILAELFV